MPRKQNTDKELAVSAGGAASAPSRRKPAITARKKREVLPAEPVASMTAPVDGGSVITSEVRVTVAASEPSFEQIASLAHAIWMGRGCQGGSPEDDWFAAEQQLRAGK